METIVHRDEGKGGTTRTSREDAFAEEIFRRARKTKKEKREKEMYIYFDLPSGLVEVSEVLEEVLPLLLVRDGVLVEDLGHVRGYECERAC